MIELDSTWNTIVMLMVAFGVGAIGGLVAELLESRGKLQIKGALELPKRVSSRYFDLGFPANILVGAVAAVAILYFFPPSQQIVTENPGGEPTTTVEYDLTKLVALALIVGSAGSRFLAALQARTIAAVARRDGGHREERDHGGRRARRGAREGRRGGFRVERRRSGHGLDGEGRGHGGADDRGPGRKRGLRGPEGTHSGRGGDDRRDRTGPARGLIRTGRGPVAAVTRGVRLAGRLGARQPGPVGR
jgi:hypothetical protein